MNDLEDMTFQNRAPQHILTLSGNKDNSTLLFIRKSLM